jgi:hypothetical protein
MAVADGVSLDISDWFEKPCQSLGVRVEETCSFQGAALAYPTHFASAGWM